MWGLVLVLVLVLSKLCMELLEFGRELTSSPELCSRYVDALERIKYSREYRRLGFRLTSGRVALRYV